MKMRTQLVQKGKRRMEEGVKEDEGEEGGEQD